MHYTTIAGQYAEDIISGEVPACVHVKRACERFKRDLERNADPEWGYYYDVDEAERWCGFLERLSHVKGPWAKRRERLVLSPWQAFITVNLFGWRRMGTKLRRFRAAYIEVPRKNGKSFYIGALGVGMLTIDGEHAAEIYSGATTEMQAWFVFGQARGMCKASPALQDRFGIEVNAKSLVRKADASSFKTVIGKPGDGASPSCAIADEYHEHKDSDQVATFQTGMGAREQPLLLMITTAGTDLGGPCYEQRADVIQILEGTVQDDQVFGIIYSIDDDDEWDTIEAQQKANPNYGISVSPEYLQGMLAEARRSATKQSSYRTKHLNQWVGAKVQWLNMLAYQACRRRDLKIEDYKGRTAYVGLDLASKLDLASMCLVIPPEGYPDSKEGLWATFWRHYVPEDRIREGGYTRYKTWHAEGWLIATEGNVIDYNVIKDDLREWGEMFDIAEVGFDPYQATQMSVEMGQEGFTMTDVRATVPNFSEPMKEIEAMIISKRIRFTMDPVSTWCMSNVVAAPDAKDNIYPRKEREESKIDDVVAMIIAMNRAIAAERTPGSIYDTQDPMFA